jgi:hypothetical protein
LTVVVLSFSQVFREDNTEKDQLPAITDVVTSVVKLSGDPAATVFINGVNLGLDILQCPPFMYLNNSDLHLAQMMRTVPGAFNLGNNRWEIGMSFIFGDERVNFHSRFASHLTPTAFSTAKGILSLLSHAPTLNPTARTRYYLQRVEPQMGNWRYKFIQSYS